MLEESKTAVYLSGLYRRSRSVIGNLVKNSRVLELLSGIKRCFLKRAVRSACIFLFTAVSANIFLSAVFHREMDLFDMIIKSAILLLSLGGYFCDANWNDVKKSSVVLNKILKGSCHAKQIKIVRIIARLNVGGPAIHTILLTGGLNDSRFNSILVSGSVDAGEKDMAYLAEERGVKPVIIPELSRKIDLGRDLAAFIKIFRLLKRERPDIVHTHTAKAGALGRTAAILAGIPVRIHTFHGHIFENYFNSFSAGIFLFIERSLAFFSKYIVVVSEAQRQDIAGRYNITKADKIRVVPLGLELERFASVGPRKGKLRNELKVKEGAILIGIVGRLVPVKNHRMFLDACKKLLGLAGGIDIRCAVIGGGDERPSLESYARGLGIGDKVAFCGWKEEMADIYADLDIVALTSLNEGTPVALIEALASGRPVVSTDVGGVKDVVEDGVNGYLVALGDSSDFAKRLLELAKDPERRAAFGRNGRQGVLRSYSKERLVRDMKALYEEALGVRD